MKNPKSKKIFKSTPNQTVELDFFEAIKELTADKNEKSIIHNEDYFEYLHKNLNAFEESGNIVLQTKDNKVVKLDSLYKETEAENNRLRKLATIEVNKEALAEVKKLLLINAEVETEAPKEKVMK